MHFSVEWAALFFNANASLTVADWYSFLYPGDGQPRSTYFDKSTDLINGQVLLSSGLIETQRFCGPAIYDLFYGKNNPASTNDRSSDPMTDLIIKLFPSAGLDLNAEGKESIFEIFKVDDSEESAEQANNKTIEFIATMFAVADFVREEVTFKNENGEIYAEKLKRLVDKAMRLYKKNMSGKENKFSEYCIDNNSKEIGITTDGITGKQRLKHQEFYDKHSNEYFRSNPLKAIKFLNRGGVEIEMLAPQLFPEERQKEKKKDKQKESSAKMTAEEIEARKKELQAERNKKRQDEEAQKKKDEKLTDEERKKKEETLLLEKKKNEDEQRRRNHQTRKLNAIMKCIVESVYSERAKNSYYYDSSHPYPCLYVNYLISAYAWSALNDPRDIELLNKALPTARKNISDAFDSNGANESTDLTTIASQPLMTPESVTASTDMTSSPENASQSPMTLKTGKVNYRQYMPLRSSDNIITNADITTTRGTFADCVETALRQFCTTILCKRDTKGKLSIAENRIPPGSHLDAFFNTLPKHRPSDYANSGRSSIRIKWAETVSGLNSGSNKVSYVNEMASCELQPGWVNFIRAFCRLIEGYTATEEGKKKEAAEIIKSINDGQILGDVSNVKLQDVEQNIVSILNKIMGIRDDVILEAKVDTEKGSCIQKGDLFCTIKIYPSLAMENERDRKNNTLDIMHNDGHAQVYMTEGDKPEKLSMGELFMVNKWIGLLYNYCASNKSDREHTVASPFFTHMLLEHFGRLKCGEDYDLNSFRSITYEKIFEQKSGNVVCKDGIFRSIIEAYSDQIGDLPNSELRYFLENVYKQKRIIDKLEAIEKLKTLKKRKIGEVDKADEYVNDAYAVLCDTKEELVLEAAVEAIASIQNDIETSRIEAQREISEELMMAAHDKPKVRGGVSSKDAVATATNVTLAGEAASEGSDIPKNADQDEKNTVALTAEKTNGEKAKARQEENERAASAQQKEIANAALKVLHINCTFITIKDFEKLEKYIDFNAANINRMIYLISLHRVEKADIENLIGYISSKISTITNGETCDAVVSFAKKIKEEKLGAELKIDKIQLMKFLELAHYKNFEAILEMAGADIDLRTKGTIESLAAAAAKHNEGRAKDLCVAALDSLRKNTDRKIDEERAAYLLQHVPKNRYEDILRVTDVTLTSKEMIESMVKAYDNEHEAYKATNLCETALNKLREDPKKTINEESTKYLLRYMTRWHFSNLLGVSVINLSTQPDIESLIRIVGESNAEELRKAVPYALEHRKLIIDENCVKYLLQNAPKEEFRSILRVAKADLLANKDMIESLIKAVGDDKAKDLRNDVPYALEHQKLTIGEDCVKYLLQGDSNFKAILKVANAELLTNKGMIENLVKTFDGDWWKTDRMREAIVFALEHQKLTIGEDCVKYLLQGDSNFKEILKVADTKLLTNKGMIENFVKTFDNNWKAAHILEAIPAALKHRKLKIEQDCTEYMLQNTNDKWRFEDILGATQINLTEHKNIESLVTAVGEDKAKDILGAIPAALKHQRLTIGRECTEYLLKQAVSQGNSIERILEVANNGLLSDKETIEWLVAVISPNGENMVGAQLLCEAALGNLDPEKKFSLECAESLLKYAHGQNFGAILKATDIKVDFTSKEMECSQNAAATIENLAKAAATYYKYRAGDLCKAVIDNLDPRERISIECAKSLLRHAYRQNFVDILKVTQINLTEQKNIESLVTAVGEDKAKDILGAIPAALKHQRLTIGRECVEYLLKQAISQGNSIASILEVANNGLLSDKETIDDLVAIVNPNGKNIGGARFLCDAALGNLAPEKKFSFECTESLLKYAGWQKFGVILKVTDIKVDFSSKEIADSQTAAATIESLAKAAATYDENRAGDLCKAVMDNLDPRKKISLECAKSLLKYAHWQNFGAILKATDIKVDFSSKEIAGSQTSAATIESLAIAAATYDENRAGDLCKAVIDNLAPRERISLECAKSLLKYVDEKYIKDVLERMNADLTNKNTIEGLIGDAKKHMARDICLKILDNLSKAPKKEIDIECALCLIKPIILSDPDYLCECAEQLLKIVKFDNSDISNKMKLLLESANKDENEYDENEYDENEYDENKYDENKLTDFNEELKKLEGNAK
ncbi:hypothetical protein FACS189472_08980 [Alphaproteobacteria bacterium]|nr:hypothetical protein FACS189472_08980 [Alphaproteobacteria bacterium]